MTDNTEPARPSTDGDPLVNVDPSTAEGRSRLLLFGGLTSLAVGHLVETSLLIWAGVGIVGAAFALNTAGKLVHYRSLPIPSRDRLALSATWVLLTGSVVTLLANFAYTRYGAGDGAYFWPLAVAGVGFGLLHMAAQSTYLPAGELPPEQ